MPRKSAGARGRRRKLTGSIFHPSRRGFYYLGRIPTVSARNSTSPIVRLPPRHVADAHGSPRYLTEADGVNISPTPSWFLPVRAISSPFFLIISEAQPSFRRPRTSRMSTDVRGSRRKLAEADRRNISPTPPLPRPFRPIPTCCSS